MESKIIPQADRIRRYADLIQKQTGRAIRPYRADGYVNMMNRYGTSKDTSEHYKFVPEDTVPDELLTTFYEGNGLFAKIIDTPAEEAIKHGFTLDGLSDQKVEDFYVEALEELDWEETAMTAIKWARLFGGSIAVLLVNDGRGLEEPLDWKNIQSIDDIRIYDRSVIQPDYTSMLNYEPNDPFRTRGSRLGMPEYYHIFSKYGSFTVHDSRCLVFKNGILPENATNSIYQIWGMPEYVRINKAIRDAELAHRSAPKLLDRSVQPVYKMKDLAAELSTEEGEERVLRRLQVIDMARGLLNSLVIDNDGEDYDFKTFQFSGVNDVVSSSCNMLSAITNIPQTILFGQGIGGLSTTDDTSMENYYNYIERIQKRMLKSNLRYLLSVIFQAGLATGEIDEIPKIKVEFNPLWSMSDTEKVDIELKKAQIQQVKAQTTQIYVQMEAIDPSEVRKKLADSEEFDVESMLDEYDDEDLFPDMEEDILSGNIYGNSPASAPAATKLPQDMSAEELQKSAKASENNDSIAQVQNHHLAEKQGSVGVLVVSDGLVLAGTRHNDFGYGMICGPGGHIESGETPEQAAFRETEEEFGISPKELIPLGFGPYEPDTGLTPCLFLCTEYEGEPYCTDLEMTNASFLTLEELGELEGTMFQPFADSIKILNSCVRPPQIFKDTGKEEGDYPRKNTGIPLDKSGRKGTIKTKDITEDGGHGSGNFGHEGRKGKLGGSKPGGGSGSAAEKDHKLGSKVSAAAQKIYDAARDNEKKITPVLQKISHSVGCELSGLEYSVKTASSVMDKIERKRKSNAEKGVDISDEQIVRDMGDLVRYTQMSKHDDLAGSTRKTIDALQNEGYIVNAVENKYLDEKAAYKGIHLDVISPEGQKFEFQIHSEESMEVKNKLHPLYEEFRKVTTPEARKEELKQEMFAISKGLRRPKNIEEIKTRKG